MRTSECLSRRQLIAVATDDAPPSLRAHVATCDDCRRRLTVVEGDLGLIAAALRADDGLAIGMTGRHLVEQVGKGAAPRHLHGVGDYNRAA